MGVIGKDCENNCGKKEGMIMISNQILQSTIEGLRGISRMDFSVADAEGKILASTFQDQEIGSGEIVTFAESQADSQVIRDFQFFKVYDEHRLEYVLIAAGGNEDSYMVGKLAAFQLQGLLVAYKGW